MAGEEGGGEGGVDLGGGAGVVDLGGEAGEDGGGEGGGEEGGGDDGVGAALVEDMARCFRRSDGLLGYFLFFVFVLGNKRMV